MMGLVLSSTDVQAQEVENIESVSMDAELEANPSHDDIWRVTVGLEHMAKVGEKTYFPFLSLKLGFSGQVTDIYRTGVEASIDYPFLEFKEGTPGGAVSVSAMWMHRVRFAQTDFFEFSQRLGVGYYGFRSYGGDDGSGWTHFMSWLFGYEFGFRLTDLISLSLYIDYSFQHMFEGPYFMQSIHAGVQVGFHF